MQPSSSSGRLHFKREIIPKVNLTNAHINVDQMKHQIRTTMIQENSETDGGSGPHFNPQNGYTTTRNDKQPAQNSSLIPPEY